MNMYQMQMKRLLAWCQACEWSAASYHGLFSRIYYVRHYEAIKKMTKNEEIAKVAGESLEMARTELAEFMQTRCMPDVVKIAVLYLVQNDK